MIKNYFLVAIRNFWRHKVFSAINILGLAIATSLAEPYEVVLTEKNARLYFPNLSYADMVGRRMVIADTIPMRVTGVVSDLPGKSDFYFGTIVSRSTLGTAQLKDDCWDSWGCVNTYSQLFVRLKPGTSISALASRLTRIYKAHQSTDDDTRALRSYGA